jgi:AcrR family transcriptional regulator
MEQAAREPTAEDAETRPNHQQGMGSKVDEAVVAESGLHRVRLHPLKSPVTDVTWEWIRQAAIDVVLERGRGPAPVSDVLARAGVARGDFDSRFDGPRECWDRVYEANLADFDRALVAPFLQASSWREGVRAGARSAAAYLQSHRRESRYWAIRMRCGGSMEQAAWDRYLQRVVSLVDAARDEVDCPGAVGRGTAEAVVGSIHAVLLRRLGKDGEGMWSPRLLGEVMYIVVRPYFGHEAALEELRMAKPTRRRALTRLVPLALPSPAHPAAAAASGRN